MTERLNQLILELRNASKCQIGFPTNMDFDLRQLYPFFDLHINNAGDPFSKSNTRTNVKDIEIEILEFFAKYLKIEKEAFWGYVTNGGTESNECGLFIAREKYSNGVLYFSTETHSSILLTAKKLRMETCVIDSNSYGEMDYKKLIFEIKKNLSLNPSKIPIIVANIGTTMTGAIDDVDTIYQTLKQNNIFPFYIHCDAAFFGGYLPFISKKNIINFNMPINSLSISLHKFLGSSLCSSVFLVNKTDAKALDSDRIEYINSSKNLLSTSRNGLGSLICWYRINTLGMTGINKLVNMCFELVSYTIQKLQFLNYPHFINQYSLIIVIKIPSSTLVKKWQLPIQGKRTHIIILPHVTKEVIDEFILDLKKEEHIGANYIFPQKGALSHEH